jgi:hypothetical protein
MDVGLLCRSCGLSVLDIERAEDLMMVNAGGVCEQFAGQHLLYTGESFAEPELYCWMREKKRDFGLRLNSDLPSLLRAETSVAGGENRSFRLLSLPLYLVEQASRLCRECL